MCHHPTDSGDVRPFRVWQVRQRRSVFGMSWHMSGDGVMGQEDRARRRPGPRHPLNHATAIHPPSSSPALPACEVASVAHAPTSHIAWALSLVAPLFRRPGLAFPRVCVCQTSIAPVLITPLRLASTWLAAVAPARPLARARAAGQLAVLRQLGSAHHATARAGRAVRVRTPATSSAASASSHRRSRCCSARSLSSSRRSRRICSPSPASGR